MEKIRNNNKYYYRKKLFMRKDVYCGKIFLWWEGSSIMKTEFYLLLEGSSGIEKFYYYQKKIYCGKELPYKEDYLSGKGIQGLILI